MKGVGKGVLVGEYYEGRRENGTGTLFREARASYKILLL